MTLANWARRGLLTATVGLILAHAAVAQAEVFELKDGSSMDGKALKEDSSFVWVKTLAGVTKVPVEDITGRTPGESPVERYEKLKRAGESDGADGAALWGYYDFLVTHEGTDFDKVAKKILRRLMKTDPDHEKGRDANGEVSFEGKWVLKTDLPRLKAEAARRAIQKAWEDKLGVGLEVFDAEHWLLLDNTGEKDLPGRARQLDDAYERLKEIFGVEELWKGRATIITLDEFDDYTRIVDLYQKGWQLSSAWIEYAKRRDGGGCYEAVRGVPTQIRFPASGDEGMWAAIIHNSAHLAVWRLWGGRKVPPTWLEEGLGAWIELEITDDNIASCVGDSKAKVGKTRTKKRKKKKGKGNIHESQGEWKELAVEAIENGEFPAMRRFLEMQIGDYGPTEEGGALGLVTWLLFKGEEEFKKLTTLMRYGGKPDDPWKETFEDFSVIEDAEKEWHIWAQTEW